jgi:deoxyribonuclease-4
VVVHVGKSTGQSLPLAMATMRDNLELAIPFATESCPILLETPAGQGTEVLCTWGTFAAFVIAINDSRLRMCVDTCHVFASGEEVLFLDERLSRCEEAAEGKDDDVSEFHDGWQMCV